MRSGIADSFQINLLADTLLDFCVAYGDKLIVVFKQQLVGSHFIYKIRLSCFIVKMTNSFTIKQGLLETLNCT